jgi:hypothetical protein
MTDKRKNFDFDYQPRKDGDEYPDQGTERTSPFWPYTPVYDTDVTRRELIARHAKATYLSSLQRQGSPS